MNNNKKTNTKYLSVAEVARRFGVDPKTVYRLAKKGEIPSLKIGNQWRFNESTLRQWEVNQKKDKT